MEPSNGSVFGVVGALFLVLILILAAELYWRGFHAGECKAQCEEGTGGTGSGYLDEHDTCLCTINGRVVSTP